MRQKTEEKNWEKQNSKDVLKSLEMKAPFRVTFTVTLAVIFCVGVESKGDDIKEVYGVVSGSANLPCNITSPVSGDSARLVLWYKDDSPQPVYSLDAR